MEYKITLPRIKYFGGIVKFIRHKNECIDLCTYVLGTRIRCKKVLFNLQGYVVNKFKFSVSIAFPEQ
jgi:hypothetical protein